ncbi:hypothetical protein EGW08_018845 [Elysia chlorotica]|uniref:Transmembrane protein n=1 Tax=Elysia chlorotica TaxID=188477 RepID=A0A3S1B6Q4_ELYCH|nr:hypothetical protein EGW08_018845 [Elysia chlorotica]
MNVLLILSILLLGLVAAVTCQTNNDPWLGGLNSDTDDVSTNCQVASGHSDCLVQYGVVVGATDKNTRCAALAIFVQCIMSECSNSNSFQTTFDALTAYCNSGASVVGGAMLVVAMAVLTVINKHS